MKTGLARLSFWVSPERMDAFETTYKKKLVPILKQHDLEESSEPARRSAEGVFSRLFEVETPSEVAVKEIALRTDAAWQELLQSLGTALGTTQPDGLLHTYFGLYKTPAGPGKTVDAGPGFRQGPWQTFGVRDGLPFPAITDILRDRAGHLWFATQGGGACRYDGAQLTTFTTEDGLAGNNVTAILEDREGNLWLGTGWWAMRGAGVSRYDGQEFVTYTTEDGLASNAVLSIVEDREGNLWFGTGDWWGTLGGGVSRYDGKEFVTFTAEDGLAHNMEDGLAGNWVDAILEDREGDLWFGTNGGGVSRYDGEQFVTFTTQDGLGDDQVCSILQDPEGDLWFGTYGGGVSHYTGGHVTTFTTEDGLVNNGVMCVLQDRQGHLWVGHSGRGGASRYDGKEFVTFTAEDGLPGYSVWDILEDREGHLWFATAGGGVSRYDAHRPDGEQFVTFTTEDGLAGNFVFSLLEDREGHLWLGTRQGGVSRYDGQQFTTFTTEDGLAHNRVFSLLEDREGHLWFGTRGGGICCYDGQQFTAFTTEDGLAGNWVQAILEDREGHLWLGTRQGGVSRYDGKEFTTFTTDDGLAHNMMTCILEDQSGHLWFGTWGGGVSRYDGLVFQCLSRRDGVAHDTVGKILQDRSGDIWITTAAGITRYRPRHTPPSIRITDVIADRRYGSVGEIRIPLSQKLLTFEFQGRSFTTRPDGMAYVVRLEGYDPDWRVAYTGRAEYEDLPLGEYTFQVKAVDRDLNYSEPAAIRIIIEADPHLEALTQALSGSGPQGEFVGESAALRRVQTNLRKIAPTNLTVLILGETGSGKGLAARTLHGLSGRKAGPFVPVHCGAIPESLVESELFGHEKGAFTGAISRKLGKVELAKEGTLFLDEIGDMPLDSQVKLLRLLEERTFERVGGTETLEADVRIVAATNRDLGRMVDAGSFRQDLYFRVQVFVVQVPPLRQRREDIPLLARYFTARMAAHLDREITHLTSEALSVLQRYDWPGNVRELENTLQRAVIRHYSD